MINNFAHLASSNLAKNDLIFRVGGDEFIIVFTNKSGDEVKGEIRSIREKCQDKGIDFSYGLSTVDNHNRLDAELLIREADMQMYNYKKQRKKHEL